MSKKTKVIILSLAVILLAMSSIGSIMSQVEKPTYELRFQQGPIEIRDYARRIIAETEVSGERTEAIKQGFRKIAKFIFGANSSSETLAMTAPVEQVLSSATERTNPTASMEIEEKYRIRFTMPSIYNMDSLPTPNQKNITLIEIEPKTFAAIKFSGRSTHSNLFAHEKLLFDFIRDNKLETNGNLIYAFYNPPWTLPIFRRNEILIEITQFD